MLDGTTRDNPNATRMRPASASGQVSVVAHGPDRAEVARLRAGGALVVGRQHPSDLCVPDRCLSRQHARFRLEGTRVFLEDLGSRNGTHVNGRAVSRAEVRPGDSVVLGTIPISVHILTCSASSPPAANADALVVRSPATRAMYDLVARVAASEAPVLIRGETGTGKERVAEQLHACSRRCDRPLRAVNCAAIPESLAESILFGHLRGAFTGATSAQSGLFEQAHQGILFLDEVAELPLPIQAKLLRVLETGCTHRLGSTRESRVDVRVVAATHRDLSEMVAAGRFREDVLYRLNAVTVEVPPLRERPEEIEPLAVQFLEQATRAWGRHEVRTFSVSALQCLKAYAWPGNIRQLRNAVERGVLVARSDTIDVRDLPPEVMQDAHPSQSLVALQGDQPPQTQVSDGGDAETDVSFKHRVQGYEVQLIEDALRRTHGNQRAASRLLRIPLRTLVHKIKHHGIKRV